MGFNPLFCVYGKFIIPQRYVTVLLLHLAMSNDYHIRVVLNILITEMQADRFDNLTDACPMYTRISVTVKEGEFKWPSNIEALILYSFYIGNVIGSIPGGWLAEKLGGKWVIGTSVFLGAIVNALYPLSIMLWDFYGAVLFRLLIGFFQGPIFPATTTLIQCWIPHREKSVLVSIIYSAAHLGKITGGLLTAFMVESFNSWALPFYVWSLEALIWCIFFMIWGYSRPKMHRFITKEELQYLHRKVAERKRFKVPWMTLMTSTPVWATVVGQCAHDLVLMTLFVDSPKYLKEILKLSVKENAFVYCMPFLLLWILSIASGYLASALEHHGYASLGLIRRSFTVFSVVVPSGLLITIPYVGCNRTIAIALHTSAVVALSPFVAGVKMNVEDLSLHYGGIISALNHAFGSVAGIFGPSVIGVLTGNQSLDEWKLVYWLVGGIATFLVVVYITMTDTKRQMWDYSDDMVSEQSFNDASEPSSAVPVTSSLVAPLSGARTPK